MLITERCKREGADISIAYGNGKAVTSSTDASGNVSVIINDRTAFTVESQGSQGALIRFPEINKVVPVPVEETYTYQAILSDLGIKIFGTPDSDIKHDQISVTRPRNVSGTWRTIN